MKRILEPEVMDTPDEAHAYAAMDHRQVNAAFVERLVELGAFGEVLDIGTGPGHIPCQLVQRLSEVTVVGIDLARHMLRFAEERRQQCADPSRVSFELADAKALPYEDGSFDTVFSNTILHHIPEPQLLIREAYRVLRKGGVLLIRDLLRPETEEQLQRLVALHAVDETEMQRALFADSLRAALTVAEIEQIVADLALVGAEVVQDTDRHLSLQIRRSAEPKR